MTRRSDAPRPAPAPLVCRWDLDKTYLRSEFDSIRQLLRTAFERPEDKIQVPGVTEVIKALRSTADHDGRPVHVFFISASPPQIGAAIRKKLDLDGVPYDGIVFKNQLQNLRPGRFRNLREHVGFKLVELLRGRLATAPEAEELLFGDDWESDSLIYSLYADILAGALPATRLGPLLGRIRVDAPLVEEVLALAARAAGADAVARIFINLERRTPLGTFRHFGPRLVPTFNYFQTAAVLAGDGFLRSEDVREVGAALLAGPAHTPAALENSLADLVRRGLLGIEAAEPLATLLRDAGVLPAAGGGSRWRRALRALGRLAPRRPAARRRTGSSYEAAALDYDAIVGRLHDRQRAAGEEEGT